MARRVIEAAARIGGKSQQDQETLCFPRCGLTIPFQSGGESLGRSGMYSLTCSREVSVPTVPMLGRGGARCGLALAGWLVAVSVVAAQERTATPQGTPSQGTPSQGTSVQQTLAPGDIHVGKSRVYVHVYKSGIGHEHAIVGMVKAGTLHLGAERDAGQVTVDLTTFRADTDAARKVIGLSGETDEGTRDKVTANMLGPHVLNVTEFPATSAKFSSAKLLPTPNKQGQRQFALEGELTFHGVTRKLQVVADTEENEHWVRLRAHWPLVQTEFGVTPYSMALGAIGVADQVDIYCDFYVAKHELVLQPAGRTTR